VTAVESKDVVQVADSGRTIAASDDAHEEIVLALIDPLRCQIALLNHCVRTRLQIEKTSIWIGAASTGLQLCREKQRSRSAKQRR
jgi:hypothetical protein